MQERERERLTLLENAILSLRFFVGFLFVESLAEFFAENKNIARFDNVT